MDEEELMISPELLKSLCVGIDWQYLLASGLSGPTLRLAFHTAEKGRALLQSEGAPLGICLPTATPLPSHSSAKNQFITSQGLRSPPGTLLSC